MAEFPGGFAGERYGHPRFSPNADRIALERVDGNRTDVYVLTRATGQVLRLTRDGRTRSPEWSADGDRVLWIRKDSGNTTTMQWQRADGSGSPETIVAETFHPAGRFSTLRKLERDKCSRTNSSLPRQAGREAR